MKILCWLNLHGWTTVAWASLSSGDSLKQCYRCGVGRAEWSHGQAFTKYTAEQMRLWASVKEHNISAQQTYLTALEGKEANET